MTSSKDTFQIVYDWPALNENTMNVMDLWWSLTALWELMILANRANENLTIQIETRVQAWFKRWCFWIEIEVCAQSIGVVNTIFWSDTATAIANMISICWFSFGTGKVIWDSIIGTSIIWLYRKLKGSKPIEIVHKTSSVIVRYIDPETSNEDKAEVIPEVFTLYSMLQARQALQKIITEPLSKDWINIFKVIHWEKEVIITKEEALYFKEESNEESTEEIIDNIEIKITSVTFLPNQKWKATYNWRSIFVKLLDQIFIDKIKNHNEKFWSDDRIIWKLLQRITESSDQTIKIEYELLEVYEHLDWNKKIEQMTVDEVIDNSIKEWS